MRPLKVSEPGKLGHVRDGELTRGQDHPIELLRNPAVHTEVVDDHGELARDLVMGDASRNAFDVVERDVLTNPADAIAAA